MDTEEYETSLTEGESRWGDTRYTKMHRPWRALYVLLLLLPENFLIIFWGLLFFGAVLAFATCVALMHFLEKTKLPTLYIALCSAVQLTGNAPRW